MTLLPTELTRLSGKCGGVLTSGIYVTRPRSGKNEHFACFIAADTLIVARKSEMKLPRADAARHARAGAYFLRISIGSYSYPLEKKAPSLPESSAPILAARGVGLFFAAIPHFRAARCFESETLSRFCERG